MFHIFKAISSKVLPVIVQKLPPKSNILFNDYFENAFYNNIHILKKNIEITIDGFHKMQSIHLVHTKKWKLF